MTTENMWPKKMKASTYAKRWHVDLSKQTIINRVKENRLPGIYEDGQWYVWVNADLTPAYDYQAPQKGSVTGNALADSILKRANG